MPIDQETLFKQLRTGQFWKAAEQLEQIADAPDTINAQTATSYTLVLSDAGKTIERNSTAANNTVIPANASVAFPVGTVIKIRQIGAGLSSVVTGATTVTMNGRAISGALAGQWADAYIVKRGTNAWSLHGDIAHT